MKSPTCEELMEENGFDVVSRSSDSSWRHGIRETKVYRRERDGTFWEANYRRSDDGETNELRDGKATIHQVRPEKKMPKEKMTVIYIPV